MALEILARRFHLTLASAACEVIFRLRKESGAMPVYFSGGVFMNDLLTRDIKEQAGAQGKDFYFAGRPQTTDLGISEGQIAAVSMGELCV